MTTSVAVVGSANLDLVVAVAAHPRPGETVMGGDLRSIPGGKGANQATASARLGRTTAFVGRVGDDDAGRTLLQSMQQAGVDTGAVTTSASRPTGTALITVADDGDNAIVVSPGANHELGPDHIAAAMDVLADAEVMLLQLEVPLDAVTAAARGAHGLVVLNPAPAPPAGLPPDLLSACDLLVPNETELAVLAGVDPAAPDPEMADAARGLGVGRVVITLGARGALVVEADSETLVPAPVVDPVDTTGAGDAFCAALADRLVTDADDLVAAAFWACRVGAATTLAPGAGPSLPTANEVEQRLEVSHA